MLIVVRDVVCPVCGAPEVQDNNVGQPFQFVRNTLNIRGFKVGDDHGWWSHCMCHHGTQNINGNDVVVNDLWFVDSDIAGCVLVQIPGHKGLFQWAT